MYREKKFNENHQNKPLAPPVYVAKPIEVKVTELHDFLYEPQNHPTSEEKKQGFWRSIFGERRCKNCSQKKCECGCKNKKKRNRKGVVERGPAVHHIKCDENPPAGVLNCSAYGTSKEIQKNGNCPTKCTLPMNQGCGCHLYFCIDSKRKKQPIKSKINKNKHNENLKTERKQMGCDGTYHEEVIPNVSIFCDESKDVLETPKSYMQTRNYPTPKTNTKAYYEYSKQTDDLSNRMESNGTKEFNFSSDDKTIFQFKSYDTNFLDIDTVNKPRLKDNETNTETKLVTNQNNVGLSNFGSFMKEENGFFLKPTSANKLPKKEDGLDSNKFDQNQSLFDDMNKGLGVLRNFTGELNNMDTIVSNVKVDVRKSFENLNMDKKPKFNVPTGKESDDSSLAKEYINFSRNRKKTRKSTAKSGLFARNSLITLRRERRHSELEERVSLILDKLGNIENKITQIEKTNSGKKENNITMGIRCEGKQSKVSIEFDKQPGKEVYANQQNFRHISPFGGQSSKTIRITSNNENIYLKTPGDVKVVRSKQREDPSNRSQQLIYENAYKMDAHTIGSNSTTIKCKNPKVVVSYQKPEPFCRNPNCSGKWRRISEELKQSNLDFVKCETCGHKK